MAAEAIKDPRSDRELILALIQMLAAVRQQNQSILNAIDNLSLKMTNDQTENRKALDAIKAGVLDTKTAVQAETVYPWGVRHGHT